MSCYRYPKIGDELVLTQDAQIQLRPKSENHKLARRLKLPPEEYQPVKWLRDPVNRWQRHKLQDARETTITLPAGLHLRLISKNNELYHDVTAWATFQILSSPDRTLDGCTVRIMSEAEMEALRFVEPGQTIPAATAGYDPNDEE